MTWFLVQSLVVIVLAAVVGAAVGWVLARQAQLGPAAAPEPVDDVSATSLHLDQLHRLSGLQDELRTRAAHIAALSDELDAARRAERRARVDLANVTAEGIRREDAHERYRRAVRARFGAEPDPAASAAPLDETTELRPITGEDIPSQVESREDHRVA